MTTSMQAKQPKLVLPKANTSLSLGIVVAMGLDRAIGQSGTMPWYVPEDLKHFKQQTLNSCVIMGRRTFESIGRPLPSRRNIVVSSDLSLADKFRVEVAGSLDEALALAHNEQGAIACAKQHGIELESADVLTYSECFVIGGARLFAEALTKANKLVLTVLNARFPQADVFFPELPEGRFKLVSTDPADGKFLESTGEQPNAFAQERVNGKEVLEYRFETYLAHQS